MGIRQYGGEEDTEGKKKKTAEVPAFN